MAVVGPGSYFDDYLKAMSNQGSFIRLQLFEKRKAVVDMALDYVNPFLEEIDEFADCILNGAQPETDSSGALKALSFVRAAIESEKIAKPVTLPR